MSAATQFIAAIASNMSDVHKPLADIKAVLEDGEALMHLGVTDEDQEMVEEAHALVSEWMRAGQTVYSGI